VLDPPIDLFDLPDGGELVTRVLRYQSERTVIKPPRAPQGVEVPVVRLFIPPEDKPDEPKWWDVTATRLQPSLLAALPGVISSGYWIRIRKSGVAPRARFSLEVLPPPFAGPYFYGRR